MLERLALVLLLLAAAARAQEPVAEDPNVLLSRAFQRLQVADNVVASVDVKHEPPEQPAVGGQGGPGGMIIMQTRIAGQEDPFEGRVEAARAADGKLILLSESELPGFALFVDGERAIERTTFEEQRFSLHQLRAELTALLEPKAFARRIFDAKLVPARDAVTGDVVFRGKVDRDVVPPSDSPTAFAEGRVLDVEATVVVRPDGTLKSAAVKITRSDPVREMMRGDMRRIVIAGGAPPPALPPQDDDRKHDIPGGSTTYAISFREGGLPERAQAFKAEAERLLGAPQAGDPPPPGPERGPLEKRPARKEEPGGDGR
ncbi:MAG TPA: hypothetical protein VFY93_15880 [Planctomycetota bacterium]|nr:hypothetical protein [Planctomycetota bacterium]